MKVLITSEWYAPVINGVVTSILNLEKELLKQGHEVRVLTLSNNRHSHQDGHVTYLASVNAAWVYPNARFTYLAKSKFIREIIDWKPDVIHTQAEFSTFLMARRIARKTGAPIVHTYHTVYEDYTHYFSPNKRIGRSIAIGLTRFVLKRTKQVVAPTHKVLNMLKAYHVQTPISVIPTGIELERFISDKSPERLAEIKNSLRIEPSQTVLIYIGRLAKEKNVEELFRFVKENADPRIVLVIVGGGPYLKTLENKVAELGIQSSVRFSGMVAPDDVPYYYAIGDLFVSASQSETQGLTYFEALSAGLPALCKEDACLEGVITNGENGWQYRSGADFHQHLEQFVREENMRTRMSDNARELAQREFSAERFSAKVAALYEKSLLEKEAHS